MSYTFVMLHLRNVMPPFIQNFIIFLLRNVMPLFIQNVVKFYDVSFKKVMFLFSQNLSFKLFNISCLYWTLDINCA